jgi:hypothetical protein
MGFVLDRQWDHKLIRDYVFSLVFQFSNERDSKTYSIPISAAWSITAGSAPRQAAIPAAAIEQATPTSLYLSDMTL